MNTNISTEKFLSPNLLSDWLIFCCGNLIHNQKTIKMIKIVFLMKYTQKLKKKITHKKN